MVESMQVGDNLEGGRGTSTHWRPLTTTLVFDVVAMN